MLAPVLLPAPVELVLLPVEPFEAHGAGPPRPNAGGERESAKVDRTGAPCGGAAGRRGGRPSGGYGRYGRRTLTGEQGPLPLPSGVTIPGSAASPLVPKVAEVHGARHSGDEAHIDRQGPGQAIEGRG